MKKLLYLSLLLIAGLHASCQTNFNNVSAEVFKNKIDSFPGVLLDVRTPQEFQSGHIKGATVLNYYSKEFKSQLLKLPKNKPIYIYCKTGARSRGAASYLASNGYTNLYNMRRGIMEWSYMKYPIQRSSASINAKDITSPSDFDQTIKTNKLVFVDYFAPWCIPCKKMDPMIKELETEYKGKVKIFKVNADASKELISMQGVRSIPYLVLYKDGKIVYRKSGMTTKEELKRVFNENL